MNAVTNPAGLEANWYNVQDIDGENRIWLMQESATSFSPTFDCSYFIIVEDANGCIDTSETYYFGEMAARIGNIVTYPNPATDLVTLEFDNLKSQVVKFDLIDNNLSRLITYCFNSKRFIVRMQNTIICYRCICNDSSDCETNSYISGD